MMDWDEAQRRPVEAFKQDLTALSIDELQARITALEEEIVRVRTELEVKRAHEQAASAIFKS
ncbi:MULTISPECIES: DUF1192 domain-containing protein [Filomicrobium]|nr:MULTISPECIES: DUF1192 domain-containing protein [Filomicrobium]